MEMDARLSILRVPVRVRSGIRRGRTMVVRLPLKEVIPVRFWVVSRKEEGRHRRTQQFAKLYGLRVEWVRIPPPPLKLRDEISRPPNLVSHTSRSLGDVGKGSASQAWKRGQARPKSLDPLPVVYPLATNQ